MKKIILIISISLLFIPFGKSQDKGDFRLGMYGQAISLSDNTFPQFGLVGEYFLSKKFSMNYRYGLGSSPNGGVMGHVNLSLLGLAFLASSTTDELLWTFFIPEGISYHAYPNDFLEIAPYINPLGSEINLYDNEPIALSCSFGMNIHIKPIEDMSFTPNLGAIIVYGRSEILPTFGFALNYNFH
jgi:hypothetical protein